MDKAIREAKGAPGRKEKTGEFPKEASEIRPHPATCCCACHFDRGVPERVFGRRSVAKTNHFPNTALTQRTEKWFEKTSQWWVIETVWTTEPNPARVIQLDYNHDSIWGSLNNLTKRYIHYTYISCICIQVYTYVITVCGFASVCTCVFV